MNHKGRLWQAALTILSVGGLGWWLVASWGTNESPLELNRQQNAQTSGRPNGDELEPGYVMVGGVKRPLSDVAPRRSSQPARAPGEKAPRDPFEYGRNPSVKPDLNPQVKSVVEAIKAKDHPERVSVLASPPPFDRAAFAANPQKYLDTVEPGRVFQTAQPGPDVPQLAPISPRLQTALQGETVRLEVRAPSQAPVTFTSFDLGHFSNRLTSITVQAGENGVAQAEFFGPPGTIEDVNILAGSPLASGQVKFIVHITLPE